MEQKMYMISDAAKQVEVESHVLRYWEEELELPIKRNKLGHRYYTPDDVNRLKRVKTMKEQGFQLKAIRKALKQEMEGAEEQKELMAQEHVMNGENSLVSESEAMGLSKDGSVHSVETEHSLHVREEKASEDGDKAYRLQVLLKTMIADAVREENQIFCDQIRETMLKELDYQFRLQEEREEIRENERIRREEEHFRKIDELIREKAAKKEKRKKHSFF